MLFTVYNKALLTHMSTLPVAQYVPQYVSYYALNSQLSTKDLVNNYQISNTIFEFIEGPIFLIIASITLSFAVTFAKEYATDKFPDICAGYMKMLGKSVNMKVSKNSNLIDVCDPRNNVRNTESVHKFRELLKESGMWTVPYAKEKNVICFATCVLASYFIFISMFEKEMKLFAEHEESNEDFYKKAMDILKDDTIPQRLREELYEELMDHDDIFDS